MKNAIYDSEIALNFSIETLKSYYRDMGVTTLLFKRLSPNDNSKNQPYFGSHLTDLSFLPTGDISSSVSNSNKKSKYNIKYCSSIDWHWLSPENLLYEAPNTQVIYYPQYPEVRLSGFLKGAKVDISRLMSPLKEGRKQGRVLFLGISKKQVIAYLAAPESGIAKYIQMTKINIVTGVFEELKLDPLSVSLAIEEEKASYIAESNKTSLLNELSRVHKLGWIKGQRLNSEGEKIHYFAPNAGGYTLEAELGVIPNGSGDPDYKGWEVKQYGVKNFSSKASKALTLMTPEPDGGYYCDHGVVNFMKKYGYLDNKIKNRINFNGRHDTSKTNAKTKLKFVVFGFDILNKEITKHDGFIGLIDENNTVAASWSFIKLITHWKNKHNKAVYIPSIKQGEKESKEYHYGQLVRIFEGCNINTLLMSFAIGTIYYDPGIKVENTNTDKPKSKRRSQFRVKLNDLNSLYEVEELIDLLS